MDHEKERKSNTVHSQLCIYTAFQFSMLNLLKNYNAINLHIHTTNKPCSAVPVYDISTILFWYRSNLTTCWGLRKVRDGGKEKKISLPWHYLALLQYSLTAKIMNTTILWAIFDAIYVSLDYLYFCHIYNESSKAESTSLLVSVHLCACTLTTCILLNRFAWNLIFGNFTKI
jgi:hypothetical protein